MKRIRPPAQHVRHAPFTDTLPSPLFFRAAQLPADASYPPHSHVWGEFVYAYSGVMEVKVDQRHYLIPPHYGLWLPPGIAHHGMNRLAASHGSLYISQDLAEPLPKEVCAITVSPLLKALLDALRQHPCPPPLQLQPKKPPDAAYDRLLQVVRDQLIQAPRTASYLPTSDDALLQPILQALEAQPSDARTLADWAATVHTTERTLIRRFERELGISLTEWRQRLRVVKAMPMLQSGQKVEAVAGSLGYASASAFIAMFRRLAGVTPDEYRRSSG